MAQPSAIPPVRVYVSADFANYEIMRFGLKEIVRRYEEDPFSFTVEEAANIARQAVGTVAEAERRADHA